MLLKICINLRLSIAFINSGSNPGHFRRQSTPSVMANISSFVLFLFLYLFLFFVLFLFLFLFCFVFCFFLFFSRLTVSWQMFQEQHVELSAFVEHLRLLFIYLHFIWVSSIASLIKKSCCNIEISILDLGLQIQIFLVVKNVTKSVDLTSEVKLKLWGWFSY